MLFSLRGYDVLQSDYLKKPIVEGAIEIKGIKIFNLHFSFSIACTKYRDSFVICKDVFLIRIGKVEMLLRC